MSRLPNQFELNEYSATIRRLQDRYLNPNINSADLDKLEYTRVNFPIDKNVKLPTHVILEWLEQNTTGKFFIKFNTQTIGFEDSAEATHFLLGFK